MADYLKQITADMKAAMKSHDKARLQVLRMLIASLKDEQLRLAVDDLSETEELAVLQKALKARRDAVTTARDLGRDDVADAEQAEIVVVEAYLPAMMSAEELTAKVRDLADEIGYSGPQDTGKLMKEWMARYKGRADGKDVQAAARSL